MDALKGFPDFETKLVTEKGCNLSKTRYFQRLNVVCLHNFANWHVLKIEKWKSLPKTN
jgi:hypothetical protein